MRIFIEGIGFVKRNVQARGEARAGTGLQFQTGQAAIKIAQPCACVADADTLASSITSRSSSRRARNA
ncbi:MAG TPA: hypothetical protein VHE37_09955, partial [Nevskiaceae bacterium]|nr:hypothetical protein [Nevskiaceae bacterium]